MAMSKTSEQATFDFTDYDPRRTYPTPVFHGAVYEPQFDETRLRGQLFRIFLCMKDGKWRTLQEISVAAHPAPEASVSALLRLFKRPVSKGGYGLKVNKARRGDPKNGLWEYQLEVNNNGRG
jgi:hypothetical protein